MSSVLSMYDFGVAPVPGFYMIGNQFNANLLKYAGLMCSQGKFLDFTPSTASFKETDVSGSGVDGVSRLSVFSMPGMVNPKVSLATEVAQFLAESLVLNSPISVQSHLGTLWLDYLLSTSVCYVEVRKSGRVDKFFGTRSVALAGSLVASASFERNKDKWGTYLLPVSSDYSSDRLRILRIASLQTDPKVSMPKAAFSCADIVSVTPVCILSEYAKIFEGALKTNIIRFAFRKDNGQLRTLDATCNVELLAEVYGQDWANKAVAASGVVLNRGYLRVPEFGISKFDSSGLRAVDLGRIQSVRVIPKEAVDLSFVDVDFTSIVPTFRAVVSSLNSVSILQMLYMRVLGAPAPANMTTPDVLRTAILEYVSVQCLLSSTTHQRFLHKLMISIPQLFLNYDGKGLPGVVDDLVTPSETTVAPSNVQAGGAEGGELASDEDTVAFLSAATDGYASNTSCMGFKL